MKTLNNIELNDFTLLISAATGRGLTVSKFTYDELGTFGLEYTLDGQKTFAGPYKSKDRINNPKDVADAVAAIILKKKLQHGVILLP
jgi:hypothetical protein